MTTTDILGTYVIPWSNTLIDDLDDMPVAALVVGATWEWRGAAHRVDGPDGLLTLARTMDEEEFRVRIGRKSRKLYMRGSRNTTNLDEVEVQHPLDNSGFVVTNGAQQFFASVMFTNGGAPLVVFQDGLPARAEEHWVASVQRARRAEQAPGSLMCFAPHTRIATPHGPRAAGELAPGDLVATRDNGPRPVLWTGRRQLSGLRLRACPEMRPVRLRAGALPGGRPDGDLVVSPDHRILAARRAADELFGTPEVLVRAADMVDDRAILRECPPEGITYCHLLLEQHEVLFANGLPCESLHPADMDAGQMPPDAAAELRHALSGAGLAPEAYGPHARRILTRPEAAVLLHAAA